MNFKKISIVISLLVMGIVTAWGQMVPNDPETRIGKLDNGMTYYIRHNAKPANEASFFILHHVGAMQEEDSQDGLAHFLEHMAFNGTKNLPGKQMLNYLESIGVSFGKNLNAGTGKEFTFYKISNVPLRREGIIDTALLVLHDWSHFITIDPKEVDNERGVIVEELRTRYDANFRINDKIASTLYNGSKYGSRNVIGTEQQLRTFPQSEIEGFYHRWYRPDLQAVMIIGDINVDEIEAKLKKLMADIPAPVNPEPKVAYEIPDNNEPLVKVATDPELTSSKVNFFIKRKAIPAQHNPLAAIRTLDKMTSIVSKALDYRLSDIAAQPDAPFVMAGTGSGSLTETCDVFIGSITSKEGKTAESFKVFYEELEKMRRFGVTQSELDRAKAEMMRAAEKKYDGRNDKRSEDFFWSLLYNFTKNLPVPSAETEWKLDSALISMQTTQMVNKVAASMITPTNQVVIVMSPEKAGVSVPTEADILNIIEEVKTADLKAYEESAELAPLISKQIKPGKVKKEVKDIHGATVWTLANGAKVVVKQTDFKNDEVVFNIMTNGGFSVLNDEMVSTGIVYGAMMGRAGVSGFSHTELEKQLAGKSVSLETAVIDYKNGYKGSASKKDIETLMQLIYLNYTEPRFNEGEFNTTKGLYKNMMANLVSNPNFVRMDSLTKTMYGHSGRRNMLSVSLLEKVKFEHMEPVFNTLYRNPANFTFTFVGDVSAAELKPLVEKYIASIPVDKKDKKKKLNFVDDNVRIAKGKIVNNFQMPMQTKKTGLNYLFSGEINSSVENEFNMNVLARVLGIRYIESVREEIGGTYAVGVRGEVKDEPVGSYAFRIVLDTDPDLADRIMDVILDEIKQIAENGPKSEDIGKIKEVLVKEYADNLRKNSVWLEFLNGYHFIGVDANSEYAAALEGIDAAKVQALAKKILADGNMIIIKMDPK